MNISGRQSSEQITRQVAQAIGLHVPDGARWDELLRGLRLMPRTAYCENTFSPLTNPADSLRVEVALRIQVSYRQIAGGAWVLILRPSCSPDGAATMRTINEGDDPMAARMEAVAIFAALHLMMNEA